ncbi:Golgi membrane exchange factor (Ric1p-Rgp1p) subunit [Ciborinia camelliae]|nr:Golgi membrane exchange factor (Ric1p-Rgp1p) subunit [Ciborinia camelliae]
MSTLQSNIRVFIQWKEQTVFAGEDIECQITFKNVATTPVSSKSSSHSSGPNGFLQSPERHRRTPSQIKNSALSPRSGVSNRGVHRSSFSLTVPPESVHSKQSEQWSRGTSRPGRGGEGHKRSVSIISMGASESAIDEVASHGSVAERPGTGGKGHGRSGSLQFVSRRHGVNGGPISAPLNSRISPHPSPLMSSPFPPNSSVPNTPRLYTDTSTVPNTPGPGAEFARRKDSTPFAPAFKFPAATSPPVASRRNSHVEDNGANHKPHDNNRLLSPRSRDGVLSISDQITPAPIARILSPSSMGGTPRSSGEFYTLSNNSTETLASEYLPQPLNRMPPYSGHHIKRSSNLAPGAIHRPPETLMMGYAQIHGSFMLDSSLISQAPFEEVKRKGAVGGQGGGVIGVESNKRDGSLLRTFGWGSIGESIGGLLGGGELSSMKDMRGMANSRSIPLLSTPQSILFVDLKLAPGESRTYKYSFKLPRGLPPSHRGKAIKISYKLVIGTQRPGGAKEQQVKSVEIPFRLLGSVNSHGELLGHDLMLPYILLRDQARIQTINTNSDESLSSSPKKLSVTTRNPHGPNDSNLDDFLAYVDELITKPRRDSAFGLLSPTEAIGSRRQSIVEEPATAKEAIDMAILRSNIATESQQSANRFEIARGGKRVAVLMLARPAYRLGETITAAIEFTDAAIPCYAIHAALETSEKVDHSIALRSEASILRVTRRIHVSHSESTLFARRIVFSPTIPVTATPEFITSGVSLDWRIRIEFVTPRLATVDNEVIDLSPQLLEEYTNDERGIVYAAVQGLECESFEVSVPIRVYGALVGTIEKEESEGMGLIV